MEEEAAGKRAPEDRGFEPMPRREKARWGKGSREPGAGLLLDWAEEVEAERFRREKEPEAEEQAGPIERSSLLQEALRRLRSSAGPEFPFDPWPNGRNGGQDRF